MDNNYYSEAMKALDRMIALRDNTEKRLEEVEALSAKSLRFTMCRNHKYYYAKRKGDKKYYYLGKEDEPEVQQIKQSHYLRQMLKDLGIEIRLLSELKDGHRGISYEEINERLPLTYRNASSPVIDSRNNAARIWKEEKLKEKARYPIKHPEQLKMYDIEGTPMRSKSEVIIANLLIAFGIPFVYELPREINGKLVYPDFTVLSTIDYKTEIIIEHEGMMDQDFYQKTFLFKVNLYLGAGLVPGKDVFFTFDDLKGGFDPSVVQDIIEARLKPKSDQV